MATTASHHAAAIITAGGVGRRMGGEIPKQFLPLGGRPILVRTLETFVRSGCFREVVLTIPAANIPEAKELLAGYGLGSCRIVPGGATRQASVRAGLMALDPAVELVLVHDGVRPLVSQQIITACLEAVRTQGAAIVAIPVKDTLKEAEGQMIGRTVDRERLWRAQTPQGATAELLRQAYQAADRDGFAGTDEASLLERIGCPVTIVAGSEANLKITLPEDIAMAEALLKSHAATQQPVCKIGHGYDVHRLVPGRPLVLGGVSIPHAMGLLGHSDADVLTHALCDALLGAVGAGDIGRHFPDSDQQYKGIDSLKLLARVVAMASERGYRISNADITVVAQRPKLAPHLPQMQKNLAGVCQVLPSVINIKATTTEGMGFTGREEGIACHAVVLLGAQAE